MIFVKEIAYAENDDKMNEVYQRMMDSDIVENYPGYIDYFSNNVWCLQHLWCKAHRVGIPTRGNHTQNYVESQYLC